MKKQIYLLLLIFCAFAASAQSGEITTNGIVYPRYTTATRPTGTLTPGTTIFNITLNTHQYYNGSTWVSITNATSGSPWTLSGNSIHNNSGSSVGINSSKPVADLEIQGGGGLLITTPYTVTTATPAAPVTMPYSGTLPVITAQAGRILDPGGTGNYLTNTNYASYIVLAPTGSTSGFRLTFESLQLGNGGSIIISTSSDPDNLSARILSIGSTSNYTTGKPFLISGSDIYIHFRISSGSVPAPGFQLLYEQVAASTEGRVYSEPIGFGLSYSPFNRSFSTGSSRARGYSSSAMGFSTASGEYSTAMGVNTTASGYSSSAMGRNTTANGEASTAMGSNTTASGEYSMAMGRNTTASGEYSTAMGSSTTASGNYSTAMGRSTTASGEYSTAMGSSTTASGNYSTAMGSTTTARGEFSTAMGAYNIASGNYSTAMGNWVGTNNQEGSFIIGDSYYNSTFLSAGDPNALYARFRNGYYLYTTANNTNGVRVLPNGTSWSSLSDSTKKERFIAAHHEGVLSSVAAMRVGTWNYKGDAANRHWGIMAQDFYKHFGKDQYGTIGNDTTIATADFDGVAFAAIKGLEERTRELKVKSEQLIVNSEKLKVKSEQLTANNEQLKLDNEKLKTNSEKLAYVTEELLAKSEKLERENVELKKRLEKLEALLTDTVTKR